MTVLRIVHVLAADLVAEMRVLWRSIPEWAEQARRHEHRDG